MQVDLFDFELPNALIALRPANPRDAARLLHVGAGAAAEMGKLTDYKITDLPQLVRAGDALIINNTKVIPARLMGRRVRGTQNNDKNNTAKIEVTLIEQLLEAGQWRCLLKPARKVAVGDQLIFGDTSGGASDYVEADILDRKDGEAWLQFRGIEKTAMHDILAQHGAMPLPPYIASKRATDSQDNTDYQTIFATQAGAVAAPTAGLHFTENLLADLQAQGITRHDITLHVGGGTFLPVKTDDTDSHFMHPEWGQITAATADALNQTRCQGGRLICVGTTSLRLLESAADEAGIIHPFNSRTDIFITPGYRFRAADMLLTNFHLPRSTLFMLVAAFAGLDTMQAAYAHAIAQQYRFYSYGDACLLERPQER